MQYRATIGQNRATFGAKFSVNSLEVLLGGIWGRNGLDIKIITVGYTDFRTRG
jgi:hypothetical protein